MTQWLNTLQPYYNTRQLEHLLYFNLDVFSSLSSRICNKLIIPESSLDLVRASTPNKCLIIGISLCLMILRLFSSWNKGWMTSLFYCTKQVCHFWHFPLSLCIFFIVWNINCANLPITNLGKKTLLSCFYQRLLEHKCLWFQTQATKQ